ncbi:hypothetical protein ACL02T_02775 [Pseudonocardia sp. RS010]|uniref:hypothetical protein n=1 Tax=Pseudonocardia sp. RS010 TaxID=3385979 RepID=UPI0039A26F60
MTARRDVREALAELFAAVGGPGGTLRVAGGATVPVTVHLAGGRISFAETEAVPSLGERLVNGEVLPAPVWQEALDTGLPVGAALVSAGAVDPTVLAAVVDSVTVDALAALAGGLAEGTVTTWSSSTVDRVGMPVGLDLRTATDRAVALLAATAAAAAHGVVPATVVEPGTVHGPITLGRVGWALAARLDRPKTVAALARSAGQAVHEAVVAVVPLLESGVCVLADGVRASGRGTTTRVVPDRGSGPRSGALVPAPRTAEPRTAEPRTAEPRTAELRTAEPRTPEPRTAEPRNAQPCTPQPRTPQSRHGVSAGPVPLPHALPRREPGASPGPHLDLPGLPALDPEGRPFETPDVPTMRRLLTALSGL